MLRKITVALVASASFILSPVSAEESTPSPEQAEKQVAVREMLRSMHLEQMLPALQRQMLAQLGPTLLDTMKNGVMSSTKLTEAKKAFVIKELEADMPALLDEVQGLFAKIDIASITLDVYAKAYAKYLSLEEIHEVAAFYKTPTGQKLLSKVPQIVGEAMPAVMKQMAPVLNEGIADIIAKHAAVAIKK